MKKVFVFLAIGVALAIAGCKDATMAQFNSLGTRHIITQYGCDGKVINQWESTGNVSNSEQSDGWWK